MALDWTGWQNIHEAKVKTEIPDCSDCDRPATHYEKDTLPMRWYCGKHAARWAKKGIFILEAGWLAAHRRARGDGDGAVGA